MHWLRARAQRNRWAEEFKLVGYEMQWTVNFFVHRANKWHQRALSAATTIHAGAAAYAYRQQAMWQAVASAAQSAFEKVRMW